MSVTTPAQQLFRPDHRPADALRPVRITPHYVAMADGSVLIESGNTRVLCNATIEQGVPGWLRNSGRGWVTAEYGMLPRATLTRTARASERGKVGGRTHETQRLIGRSLRSVVDMKALGERTIILDCDVLQADGGTRTAAITGAYCALHQAVRRMQQARMLSVNPLRSYVAAGSVGIVEGESRLDLDYAEDFLAETDMNVVMVEDGRFIELQATAEKEPLSRGHLDELLGLASKGIRELIIYQKRAIAALG